MRWGPRGPAPLATLVALPLACSAPPPSIVDAQIVAAPPPVFAVLPTAPAPLPSVDTARSLEPRAPGPDAARSLEPRAPGPDTAHRGAPGLAAESPCAADADCGYDPTRGSCLVDPRANRQPLLVDQGLVCYCDDARCAALRVTPVPCESDASCAVRPDPRPHPIAADAAHPHQRGRPCRDFAFTTTCERTNICTMHRLRCPRP